MFICSSVLFSSLNVNINFPIDPVKTSILFSMGKEFALNACSLLVTMLADEEAEVKDFSVESTAVTMETLETCFSAGAISLGDTNSFEDALSDKLSDGNGLLLQVSSLRIR